MDPAATDAPSITAGPTWFVGEANTVTIEWLPASMCAGDNGWNCSPPPTQVLRVDSVACDGCTIVDDPTGGTSGGLASIGAIATRDDNVRVRAHVTYVPTGESATVSTPIVVDHEVALAAQCQLIDTQLLTTFVADTQAIDGPDPDAPGYVPFRACGATRRSTETVVVFPQIATSRGDTIFPFAPDDAAELGSDPNTRHLSALAFSTPPSSWWYADGRATADFAVFPRLAGVDHIDLRTRLSTGAMSATSVAIPTLCDTDVDCAAPTPIPLATR